MNRRFQDDPELSVTEFTRQFQQSPHNYGWVYATEISEDVYRTYTYHSIWTFTAPNLTFRFRETQERIPDNYRSYGPNKRHGAVVTSSPYDFHGLVEPAIDWSIVNTIEGPVLSDASFDGKIIEEDICFVGKAKVFDNRLLGTRPIKKRPLPIVTAKEAPSIMNDPIIQDLLKDETKAQIRVFITEKALAAIAVCNRAVCPFELVFQKDGKNVFVYPRSEMSPAIMESTLETITIPSSLRREDVGSDFIGSLQEASNITAQFISAANGGESKPFQIGDDVKLADDDDTDGTKPYVYRRFILNEIEYIIRFEIDCLRDPVVEGERPSVAICRTFYDHPTSLRRTNWAIDLEKQRSSLLLAEVKDNSNMFARWVAIGRLMNASQIFLAFAERKVKSNASAHVILAAERQAYGRSAGMISLTEKNMMGLIYLIFSKLNGQNDGLYHFQHDAKKRVCRIYKE